MTRQERETCRLIGFCIGVSLLVLLALFWPAWGVEKSQEAPKKKPAPLSGPAYLTREVRQSENFGEDAKAAIEAMRKEYESYGCRGGSITHGISKANDPDVVVFIATCRDWGDGR